MYSVGKYQLEFAIRAPTSGIWEVFDYPANDVVVSESVGCSNWVYDIRNRICHLLVRRTFPAGNLAGRHISPLPFSLLSRLGHSS